MLKNLTRKTLLFGALLTPALAPAALIEWEGKMSDHVETYNETFTKFRKQICVPKAEEIFDRNLKKYRGQGYWIPEINDDVDVASIRSLLPEFQKKLAWIKKQKEAVKKVAIPKASVTSSIRTLLDRLLTLKKIELESAEKEKDKVAARKESLKLMETLQKRYQEMLDKVPFFTNYHFPVDHLKNRKVFDQYREKEDEASTKIANYTFLYRKILEDGAYNKDHTGSDIYFRTTLDTLHFELQDHDFYLTEDARYDLEFVLGKIEAELKKGKERLIERLTEWEERTERTSKFYESLTNPDNTKTITVNGESTTANKELIKEHNRATDELKEFVYTKQAEVYQFWSNQPEILKSIFSLETILLNEVGGVDGDDALERMDVARVVKNRLDKPQYLSIGKKEFVRPYILRATSEFHLKNERWLNALFKQGEFSFTYYYMSGVAKIFCPDMAPAAKKLRKQNVEIALQVLKEPDTDFKATRYFSRASMVGRIHMDSVWEDYVPYPERPGLLASGQEKLRKALKDGKFSYLYSFDDPEKESFQVLEIGTQIYALKEDKGLKIFYHHRNPHYFRYFTKIPSNSL